LALETQGLCQLFAATGFETVDTRHHLRRPSSSRLIIERHRRITLRLASHSLKIASFPWYPIHLSHAEHMPGRRAPGCPHHCTMAATAMLVFFVPKVPKAGVSG
jgi:hypothetical protein